MQFITYYTITCDVFFTGAVGTFLNVSTVGWDMVIFVATVAPHRYMDVFENIYNFTLYSNSFFKEVSIFWGREKYFKIDCLLIHQT